MAQQAFVLWFADEGTTNLAALNSLLAGGRHVVFASAMSGTGEQGGETPQSPFPYSRATVVLDQGDSVTQRAFVLWFGDEGTTNLGALNSLLAANWRVVNLGAMSGTGEHGPDTPQSPFPYSRALAILQR
jgi:hypothetical protein